MADIRVTASGSGTWTVEVREGSGTTTHRVGASAEQVRRYGGDGCDPEALIRASFEFLLEREPKESILSRFDLPVIGRYFPEYERVIGTMLAKDG